MDGAVLFSSFAVHFRPFSSCSEKARRKRAGPSAAGGAGAGAGAGAGTGVGAGTGTGTPPGPAGRVASAVQHVLFGKPGSGDEQTMFSSSPLFISLFRRPFSPGPSTTQNCNCAWTLLGDLA